MRFGSFLSILAILSASLVAHADTFQYELSYSLLGDSADATFTSPTLITSDTTVAATGTSTSGAVTEVTIYAAGDCIYVGGPFACFSIGAPGGPYNLFLDSLPTTTGVFADAFGDGDITVTVTDTGTNPPPVPEPSTLMMLGTGVLGTAGAFRRRFGSGRALKGGSQASALFGPLAM